MHERIFAKILAVNQVVFKLMGKRCKNSRANNTNPGGDGIDIIEVTTGNHTHQRQQHNAKTDPVLVLQERITLAQTLFLVGWRPGVPVVREGALSLGTNLSPYDMASMTAENITALEAIRVQHYVEMTIVLLVVFGLHVLDLVLTQRKRFQAGPGPGSENRVIIPIDSELVISAPAAPKLKTGTVLDPLNSEARIAGPFDETERNLPSGSDLFDSTNNALHNGANS